MGSDGLKVRTLRVGGTSKTYESVQGGGGQKPIDIERRYFLNGPKPTRVHAKLQH